MSILFASTLILVSCLVLSFLLSGMEAGVLALSRFRVRQQMRDGSHRAQMLHSYLENPENFLWTILVGNTLSTFAAFTVIVIVLLDALNGRAWLFLVALAIVVFLFYAFCDLLPKMLFRQYPNRLCLAAAVPFRLLHFGLAPMVAILTWFSDALLRLTGKQPFRGHIFSTRREMRLAIQESAQIFTSEERAMVNRVLDLQDLTVRSITVPLHKVVGITTQTPVRELIELCRAQPLNRLPVWQGEGQTRRIVGVLSLSTLLYRNDVGPNEPAARYARLPLQLREDVRLEEALRRMQRTRQRMAIILGFDQRELGIVNLRDILKSIFGDVTL
jgi:putative hemolysin